MQFLVLGPLEVRRDGQPLDLGGRMRRAVLAALLVRRSRVVSTAALLAATWGDDPPDTARASLCNHVSRLRRTLGPEVIETCAPGYLLQARPEQVDADRFLRLVVVARAAEAAVCVRLLRDALAVWRGDPLADVTLGGELAAEVRALEEARLAAFEELYETELTLGRHREIVPELEKLVARYPLRERFLEQLMLALYRSERQADALSAYAEARRRLLEELGLDPSEALRRLQRAILAHERPTSARIREDVPLDALRRALELAPADYRTRADVGYRLGIGFRRMGEIEHAAAAFDDARALARSIGARDVAARAELELATLATYRGDLAVHEYVRAAEQSLAVMQALGDTLGLAVAGLAYAVAKRDIGDIGASIDAFERAADHGWRAVGDSWPTGLTLNALAYTLPLGPVSVGTAIRRCEEILQAVDWGPPGPIAAYAGLGVLHALAADADTARTFVRRALVACEEYDLRIDRAGSIGSAAALVEELAGDDAEAERILRTCHDELRELSFHAVAAVPAAHLAAIAAARGDADEAERLAATVTDPADFTAYVPARRALARSLALRGRVAEAEAVARDAVARTRGSGCVWFHGGALLDLAHVLDAAGRRREARAAARRAEALHAAHEQAVPAARARALLGRLATPRG